MKRCSFFLFSFFLFFSVFAVVFVVCAGCRPLSETTDATTLTEPIRTLEDWSRLGRAEPIRRVVCSGSGALRLITYLQCSERVVAVEQVEKSEAPVSPYRILYPEYGEKPVFGEGHGRDSIEFLLSLDPKPDVIVRVDSPGSGVDPRLLQERTGIPVVLIPFGDFGANREEFNHSLRLLGAVLDKQERAEELLAFFDSQIAELRRRASAISDEKLPNVYLGGLSYRGARGLNSTSLDYPPFDWLNLRNPAAELKTDALRSSCATVSKEQILVWNPDYIFVDLGTLGLEGLGGVGDLTSDPIYRRIAAFQEKRVYGVYPNNSYNCNFEATLVDAWFIGKTVWPELFSDVDFDAKIDEIIQFVLGKTMRDKTPSAFERFLFRRIPISDEN